MSSLASLLNVCLTGCGNDQFARNLIILISVMSFSLDLCGNDEHATGLFLSHCLMSVSLGMVMTNMPQVLSCLTV